MASPSIGKEERPGPRATFRKGTVLNYLNGQTKGNLLNSNAGHAESGSRGERAKNKNTPGPWPYSVHLGEPVQPRKEERRRQQKEKARAVPEKVGGLDGGAVDTALAGCIGIQRTILPEDSGEPLKPGRARRREKRGARRPPGHPTEGITVEEGAMENLKPGSALCQKNQSVLTPQLTRGETQPPSGNAHVIFTASGGGKKSD